MTMYRSGFTALALAGALVSWSATQSTAQTLTIGVRAGPESIDPHFTATGTHAEALKHVFDSLTWSGDGLEIEPRLAESWKAVDNTTWEFKLRKGVKFHSGVNGFTPSRDFNADDVLWSFERQWKAEHPYAKVSGGAYDYFNDMGMPDLLKSIEKIDDNTVKVTL